MLIRAIIVAIIFAYKPIFPVASSLPPQVSFCENVNINFNLSAVPRHSLSPLTNVNCLHIVKASSS